MLLPHARNWLQFMYTTQHFIGLFCKKFCAYLIQGDNVQMTETDMY